MLGDNLKANLRFESFVNSDRCKAASTPLSTKPASLRALLIQIGVKQRFGGEKSYSSLRALLIQIGVKQSGDTIQVIARLRALLIQIGVKHLD